MYVPKAALKECDTASVLAAQPDCAWAVPFDMAPSFLEGFLKGSLRAFSREVLGVFTKRNSNILKVFPANLKRKS